MCNVTNTQEAVLLVREALSSIDIAPWSVSVSMDENTEEIVVRTDVCDEHELPMRLSARYCVDDTQDAKSVVAAAVKDFKSVVSARFGKTAEGSVSLMRSHIDLQRRVADIIRRDFVIPHWPLSVTVSVDKVDQTDADIIIGAVPSGYPELPEFIGSGCSAAALAALGDDALTAATHRGMRRIVTLNRLVYTDAGVPRPSTSELSAAIAEFLKT